MRGPTLAVLVTVAAPLGANDPALSDWFRSLTVPDQGGLCCAVSDCRRYPVVANGEDYFVLYEDEWLKVPKGAVLERTDNPTGDYIVCISHDHWTAGAFDGPIVQCLVKPPRV